MRIKLFCVLFIMLCTGIEPAYGQSVLDANLVPMYGDAFVTQYGFGFELEEEMPELEGQDMDYFTIRMNSGGYVNISESLNEEECLGYTSEAPDYSVEYRSYDEERILRFFFVSQGDTTLIIQTPDKKWYCNDDSFDTYSPTISFESAPEGSYNIWVGSYQENQSVDGILEFIPI